LPHVFLCQRCGARNKPGQRFCTGCGERFFYRCDRCGSFIDLSHRFCTSCRAPLRQTLEPEPDPFPQPVPLRPPAPKSSAAPIVLTVLSVLLIGVGVLGYWAYRFSNWGPQAPTGFDLYQEPQDESEPYVKALPDTQYSGNPPYVKASDEPIYLVNNPDARDVTFDTLKAFILGDNTDQERYVSGIRMCGHFAERLHNNAEKAGIRAAFVVVEFKNEPVPHALNAFQTTDRGLIYIDCTGVQRSPAAFEEWIYKLFYPVGQDRMAYIKIGKEYGAILLEDAEMPQYSYYVGYSKSWIRDEYYFFERPGIVSNVKLYW